MHVTVPHILAYLDDRYPATLLLGDLSQEVVGESHRMVELDLLARRIAGTVGLDLSHSRRKAIVSCYAWLIGEPANSYDPNAIRVFIGSTHVGYLPREITGIWREILTILEQRHGRRIACVASIRGVPGNRRWGVWLQFPHTSSFA